MVNATSIPATGIGSTAGNFGTVPNMLKAQNLEIAAIYLTVLTNVMVTALIIFYILRERRALSRLQVKPLDLKLYTGVVALMIESALPLSIAGVVFAALYTTPIPDFDSMPILKAQTFVAFMFYVLCRRVDRVVICAFKQRLILRNVVFAYLTEHNNTFSAFKTV
ncbi:hypothetical protein H1R20_g3079, partial [Candolleomyces eurysporus]